MNTPKLSALLGLHLLAVVLSLGSVASAEEAKIDARYPYRTDFANPSLAWYELKPGEFPPMHSDHRVSGTLVAVDYVHRTGQYRELKGGALKDFRLLPFAVISYQNAPADLRDVPIGTNLLFGLFRDGNGDFTQAGLLVDDFTVMAGHGFSYRLDEARLSEGKLLVTARSIPKNQPDLGHHELVVAPDARVWKGDQQLKLSDLAPGDSLLVETTEGFNGAPRRCTDIWVGDDTHQAASDAQRTRHAAFVKERGLPAMVEGVEGQQVTVTLLSSGDQISRKELQAMLDTEFAEKKGIYVAVANDELRTYNVVTDHMRSQVTKVQKVSGDGMGNSGFKMIFTPVNLLEGFRPQRIVRIFADKWPEDDMPYGETLSAYRQHPAAVVHELLPKEIPSQYPYRTDYGNADRPWYQLQPGVVPPPYSEHVITGELLQVDAANRRGQFRTDRTGELVDFTLLPQGARVERITMPKPNASFHTELKVMSVTYLDSEANLADIPLGTRCRFHLYQDEHGAFTKASLITDDFSWQALNQVSYRLEKAKLNEGKLYVATQIPPAFNYHGDPTPVPDIGRQIFSVNDQTHVWKNGQPIALKDLAENDVLLVNFTGEPADGPAHCRDIWVGPETQKLATTTEQEHFAATNKTSSKGKAK